MAEETMRAFDLTKVDDSDIMTQPFSLSDTDPIISEKKSNVMTGEEFTKLGKISSSWNDPAWKKTSASEVFGTEKVDLTKPEEFIASTSQGFIDEVANFPDKIKNETAQIVMEAYTDKNKLTQRLVGLFSKVMPQLPVGTQPDELVRKIVEKSDIFKPAYDEKLVDDLDGREYPLVDWARKTLSTTTKAIQDRDLARVIQAEQRGIDRDAWSNQLGTTIGAMMPVIALGKGVGGISKALGATAETASKVGATAMKAGTLAQMTGDYAYTTAAQYLDKTGDSDFTNFTPEDAKGLSALGYGAIGTMIEYGFGGVEPLFASGMEKLGTSNILKAVGKTMAGEAWEEFLQEWEEFLFRTADGTNTRTWGETLKDSLKSAVYGGLIGGVVGDVAYRTNRRNIANALTKTGMDYGTAIKIADTVIEDTGQEIFKRADENLSLTNKVGESFSKLQGNIKVALETAGWSENIIDPATQQPMNIDTYANMMATDISGQIIRQASLSGLSPNEFMDVSQFQAIDNVVYLKPLGSKKDIKSQIDAQDFIIKRQRELKKTGAEDGEKLKLAQMRKNILKKAYDIKEYQEKRAKERIKAQTTPETAQEIETATKDVETVKGTTQAEFDSKVDTENLTSAEKSKRYGNAVLKSILPTKTDFDAVMVDPMYANAKQAIIAVADRINSFIKAHRTYGLKTDIANALKKMQTVNQGNFIDSVTTPDLDGVDVIAENAFLYHLLFSDATTIQTYLDSYITRAEDSLNQKKGKLSKKDLVGQSFKATDNAMQTQAQVIGAEYTSIYNEDGSYADKNVMAVMLSYQNQFVQEQPKTQIISYSDSEVLGMFAKAKNNGDITLDNWENVRWSSLLSAGDTYQKGKRNKPATETEKAKFARKMLDKYLPGWNQVSEPQQLTLFQEQFDLADENARLDAENPAYTGDTIRIIDPTELKQAQYEVIKRTNPMTDDYHVGIRSADDIKTFAETINDDESFVWGDYSREDARRDLAKNEITIYSSYPIENGVFVSTSRRQAQEYAGGRGAKVYERTVPLDYVAWINGDEGQFAITDVVGKKRTVFNSNGDRIAQSEPALRNFYNWFGDSKVVDEQGRPQVVYHATNAEFDTFDKQKQGTGHGSALGKGFYFSTYEYQGEDYGKNVMPVYLKIENPMTLEGLKSQLDDIIKMYLKDGATQKDIEFQRSYVGAKTDSILEMTDFLDGISRRKNIPYSETLNKLGFDGIFFREQRVALEPNQIKSVDNRGTYSADTGNIYYQRKKANGFYDPELGVIVLGRNMNEMTLPHEMQHYWLDKIFSIYKRAKSGELQVRDEWMTETKALFDMLGIDENQTQLTQGQQEKFARMSEAYLTGIGVTGDMNATFKEYQQWVPEKYKSILNLGYLSDDGKIEYPFLDQGAVDFFNKWYANYSLPSLHTSPERQEFINPEDENGEVLPVSIKEMNNRDKEFGNDAEEQVKTDQRLYNTLDENMPAEIKIESDGQKVVQESRSNFLKESEKQQRRWFERKSRDTEAQMAQDYIEKNPEHAKEVIFGDPELIPNDTGIDRATLINAYMALNNITPESEDWATLHTNIAINQSLAGTQLALSNNTSYRTYLDALREIENAREMKAATNYAGAKQGAVERFNRDIQRFVDEELPKVLATAPNTEARDIALKSLFERARTKFSGNTTGGVLNQMDFDYARGQKGASAAFTRWAVNQIKKDAGAKLNGQEQAQLLNLSAKAQQAVIDLDDRDVGKAVAGAQEIRKWQVEKDKIMGVKPQKFSLFGDYAPRAMLASFNTLVVSNIPSTAMNTAVVRMLESGIFGKNEVSKSLTDSEIKRIKAIYGATAMNLAQMEKPTSPSLLHGEKYSSSGQKWYDPFTILGKEDNWFRVPTFVNTLARIATQDAKTTGKSADEVFKEYCRLENQSDAAKLARKQALAVSNMAVFTQDGALARSLNGIRDWINQGSRALVGLDPKGFGLGNLLSPFLKTGANIAEMGIRGSLAPITSISALVQKWRSGKAIDPMKKLALAMDWSYFLLSSVMVSLLAALTSDDDEFYSEPYEMGKPYDPDKPYDSINIAGVWIDLDFFGPFAIPIRTGCRLVKQWKTDNLSAIYKGYGEGLKYAAMDTPLLESVFNNQMSYAAKKPEDWATGYVYNQVNKLVPSQIKPLSRAISRGTKTQLDMGWSGKVIERKFHRNYGFDGAELATQDLIDIFTTKITWQP